MDIKKRYSEKNKEIEKKISLLSKKIKAHKIQFKEDSTNWGYVGDLSYVNEKIEDVLSFLK